MAIQGPEIKITVDDTEANSTIDSFTSDTNSKIKKTAELIQSHMDRAMGGITSAFSKAFNIITKGLSTIGALISALFGQRVIGLIFNTVNQFKSLENVFSAFSTSTEEATQQMDFLVESSKKLGFNVVGLADSFKKMYVAGRITGFTSEKIQEIFSSVAEAGVVAGMSTKQLEGALRALHQMMSKGKVSAEELRGQLGEHLPGAFELAAEAIGATTKELDKMLSTGDVTTRMLFEHFPEKLREAYGPALAGALVLPRRELERLKNDIVLGIRELDDAFVIISNAFLKMLRNVTKVPDKTIIEILEEQIINLATIFDGIPEIVRTAIEAASIYFDPLFKLAKATIENIVNIFSAGYTDIAGSTSLLLDFIQFSFKHLPVFIEGAVAKIKSVWATLISIITVNANNTYIALKFILEGYLTTFKIIGTTIESIFLSIAAVITGIINGLTTPMQAFLKWTADIAEGVGKLDLAEKLRSVADIPPNIMKSVNDALFDSFDNIKQYGSDLGVLFTEVMNTVKITVESIKVLWTNMLSELDKDQQNINESIKARENQFAILLSNLDKALEKLKLNNLEALKLQKVVSSLGKAVEPFNEKLQQILEIWTPIAKQIEDSISNSLTDAFVNFIETGKLGLKALLAEALTDIAKIIFHELVAVRIAKMIISVIDDIITKMATQDIFGSILGAVTGVSGATAVTAQTGGVTQFFATPAGGFKFEKGGIMTPKGVLPLNKYTKGGIANKPQIALFGEGRKNEAYVPLPDGKSIPVSLKGSPQTNIINNTTQGDISININIENTSNGTVSVNESKNENTPENSFKFARLISNLVNKEIITQKRPGGLLASGGL